MWLRRLGGLSRPRTTSSLLQLLLLLLHQTNSATSLDLAFGCNATAGVGLESGGIADVALSASSSFDDHSTGPQNARLNVDRHGGAWCPKPAISESVKEWIQVDLDRPHIITGVVTQGRYGKGKGQEYVQHFMLEYQRSGQKDWKRYTDKRGNQIFNANSDTVTAVATRLMEPPIFGASHVRIVPYSVHPRIVCLRFELHGCPDLNDMVGYSSPVPDLPGSAAAVANVTVGKWWSSEEEQRILSDGSRGVDVSMQAAVPTYDQGWMGWKRRGSKPIELVFEFNSPRNFSRIHIFASNRFDLGIKVFKRAVLWFSNTPDQYHQSGQSVSYEYMPDKALQNSRRITIPAKNRIGKFVKMQLYFEDIWILISEIDFESIVAEEKEEQIITATTMTTVEHFKQQQQETTESKGLIVTESSTKYNNNMQQAVEKAENSVFMEVMVGVLTAVTLLLLFFFVLILLYSKRQKLLSSPASRSLNPFPVQLNMKDMLMNLSPSPSSQQPQSSSPTMKAANITANPSYSDESASFYETFRPSAATAATAQLFDEQLLLSEEFRAKWHSTGHVSVRPPVQRHSQPPPTVRGAEYASVDIVGGGSMVNVNHFRSLQQQQQQQHPRFMHHNSRTQQPPLPHIPTAAAAAASGEGNTQVYNLGNYFPRVASEPPSRKSYYSSTVRDKVQQQQPLAETCWNMTTSVQALCNNKQQQQLLLQLEEIPRSQFRLKESMGRGCLGEVLVCEIDSAYSNMPQPPVALRSAQDSFVEREEFLRECRLLASLQHPNVARLVGVCTTEEPYCSVLEYSSQGDLYHFLRRSELLGLQKLLDLAAQVAAGMKYLESRGIVHKDLAARNCLVSDNGGVKVTDLAMGVSRFSGDYSDSTRGSRKVALRWQPWETVLLGRVTSSSNVWSFGVTAWELLTLCRQKPFNDLSDAEVLQNAEHVYYNDAMQVELTKPEVCSDEEVWGLLEECWNRDEHQRPTFAEICLFLRRRAFVACEEMS